MTDANYTQSELHFKINVKIPTLPLVKMEMTESF